MGKRDIRIQYDGLEAVEQKLDAHRKAVDDLRKALEKTNRLAAEGNASEAVETLGKKYKKAKKRLDDCYEEADALYNLLHGYRKEMTGIIKPERGMTRVGRNDIYWNLESVKNGIDNIKRVQDSHSLYPSSGEGKTEEEKQAMERNYRKLEAEVWGRLFPAMRRKVEQSRERLQRYYDEEITDYENKDDAYKLKSEQIRYRYSDAWELYRQNRLDDAEFIWNIIKGAGMAVWDLLKGLYSIGNMVYYGISADAAAVVYLLSEDPPEWTEKALGDSEEYFGKIAEAVSHPVETVEAMAQSAGDTYEKEGLAFMISYAVTDAAVVKVAVGKTGRAGAVKAVDKADDAADVAKMVDKADAAADAVKAADKADDAADVAKVKKGAGEAVDDIPNRPSWQQSEIDAGDMYPGYDSQKSFLNGEEVPRGTKGSSRPEYHTNGHSIEVKNYNIESSSGINNLANNVSMQVNQRTINLPAGTKQTIVIDVRGQTYTKETLEKVVEKISSKCSVDVEIIFMK